MKSLFIVLSLFFSSLSNADQIQKCAIDQFVDAPEFDTISVHDLKSSTIYVKIKMNTGDCAVTLRPENDVYATNSSSGLLDGLFDIASRTFSMKTYGQEFCIKSGSIWEVSYSGATMKTAYLQLKPVGQPLAEALTFTTYYESSMKSAKNNGIFALKCNQ